MDIFRHCGLTKFDYLVSVVWLSFLDIGGWLNVMDISRQCGVTNFDEYIYALGVD